MNEKQVITQELDLQSFSLTTNYKNRLCKLQSMWSISLFLSELITNELHALHRLLYSTSFSAHLISHYTYTKHQNIGFLYHQYCGAQSICKFYGSTKKPRRLPAHLPSASEAVISASKLWNNCKQSDRIPRSDAKFPTCTQDTEIGCNERMKPREWLTKRSNFNSLASQLKPTEGAQPITLHVCRCTHMRMRTSWYASTVHLLRVRRSRQSLIRSTFQVAMEKFITQECNVINLRKPKITRPNSSTHDPNQPGTEMHKKKLQKWLWRRLLGTSTTKGRWFTD